MAIALMNALSLASFVVLALLTTPAHGRNLSDKRSVIINPLPTTNCEHGVITRSPTQKEALLETREFGFPRSSTTSSMSTSLLVDELMIDMVTTKDDLHKKKPNKPPPSPNASPSKHQSTNPRSNHQRQMGLIDRLIFGLMR